MVPPCYVPQDQPVPPMGQGRDPLFYQNVDMPDAMKYAAQGCTASEQMALNRAIAEMNIFVTPLKRESVQESLRGRAKDTRQRAISMIQQADADERLADKLDKMPSIVAELVNSVRDTLGTSWDTSIIRHMR